MISLCREEDVLAITGGESDATLTAQVEQASRWVQATILARDFEAGTALVDIVDGTGSDAIYVPRPPVRTLTTVEIYDGVVSGAVTWRELSASDGYVFETDYSLFASDFDKDRSIGAIYQRDGRFVRGPRYYRVTYDGGLWSAASQVSADLRHATAMIVAYGLNQTVRGGPGIQARTITGETSTELVTFSDRALQEEVREILDGWRVTL